ncbi:hypothetical protein NDU88_002915 [Pleurodeles waltl]|uniref:Uncharacterized protein n=1 Tax=Pleurodeles waltl TaxID=8319 RepID=A0AAV7VE85_PLEWA|nr:hypothetical protein NDU88_002915 [Pleurodeles waltl]
MSFQRCGEVGRESKFLACLPAALSELEEERRGRGQAFVQTAAGDRHVRDRQAAEDCAPEVSGSNLPATLAKASIKLYRQGNMPETERLLGKASTINDGEKIHIFQSIRQSSAEVPADKGFERELLPLRPAWGLGVSDRKKQSISNKENWGAFWGLIRTNILEKSKLFYKLQAINKGRKN